MSMSLLPHVRVFLFVFLLASPSHVLARVAPDERHAHGSEDSSNTNTVVSGNVPATLPAADQTSANNGGGRSRTLWSTPSDGAGH